VGEQDWRTELTARVAQRYGEDRAREIGPAIEAAARAIERVLALELELSEMPPPPVSRAFLRPTDTP
jgi:hypothetical protein